MIECAVKFEELANFSLSVIPIDKDCKSKFMHRLKIKIIKYVNFYTTGSLTYAKAI